MKFLLSSQEPWVVCAGRWLTKRRGILLAPFFVVSLAAARFAIHPWVEWTQDLAGLLSLLAGSWLRMVAASYHDSSHHAYPITAGPYARVRHPLYIANFFLGLGIVLLAGWGAMVMAYLIFFIPLHAVIMRSEEVHLSQLYGEGYTTYLREVPAVIPWRRYRGVPYGSRSSFKIEKGQERLKLAGYLAAAAAIVLWKELRAFFRAPLFFHPLPPAVWILGVSAVAAVIVLRPQVRRRWIRAAQTTLAVLMVLALALHLPGVWPSNPQKTSENPASAVPISKELTTVASRAPVPSNNEAAPVSSAAGDSRVKTTKRSAGLFQILWNHLELIGAASAFGVAAWIEQEREGRFRSSHELQEAGQAAFAVAISLAAWKQIQLSRGTLAPLPEENWCFRLGPEVSKDDVSLLATLKRKF